MTKATPSNLLGLTVLEDKFMTVVVESMAEGMHGAGAITERLHLDSQAGADRVLTGNGMDFYNLRV